MVFSSNNNLKKSNNFRRKKRFFLFCSENLQFKHKFKYCYHKTLIFLVEIGVLTRLDFFLIRQLFILIFFSVQIYELICQLNFE